MEKLVKRNRKVAFLGVLNGETVAYQRMQHFTEMGKSSNPDEYSRKYVDEDGEVTDITGYAPSISYAFDQYEGNKVHQELITITDGEIVGTDAVRTILLVDFTRAGKTEGSYIAIKRDYAVVPDSDGDDENTYTYSGSFKSQGGKEEVEVTSNDDFKETCTIVTPEVVEDLGN